MVPLFLLCHCFSLLCSFSECIDLCARTLAAVRQDFCVVHLYRTLGQKIRISSCAPYFEHCLSCLSIGLSTPFLPIHFSSKFDILFVPHSSFFLLGSTSSRRSLHHASWFPEAGAIHKQQWQRIQTLLQHK
jgi:hypothetical protein